MSDTQEPTTETPAESGPAVSLGELQPPQYWTGQPAPDDDDADSALGSNPADSTASVSSSILQYRTINGRTYHSDRGASQYWGPNDEPQNEVLDIQHHVFTLLQDGKLHYAPLPDKMEKAIDVGTGTGIWAIDFGDEYPDTQVIGTDLSPIQPSWVPPNVRFEIDDFTQEWTFPEASIDYVHMRWLIGCVTDWKALFQQAYKVLKPGAWIESFECNGFFESDDGTVTEKSAMAQWGILFREGAKKMGSTSSFSVVRDQVQRKSLQDVGFVNIQEKPLKIPVCGWPKDQKLREVGHYSRAAIENDIEGTVGFSASQLGWTPEEVTVYAAHLRRELRGNNLHGFYRANVVWAQKPALE